MISYVRWESIFNFDLSQSWAQFCLWFWLKVTVKLIIHSSKVIRHLLVLLGGGVYGSDDNDRLPLYIE